MYIIKSVKKSQANKKTIQTPMEEQDVQYTDVEAKQTFVNGFYCTFSLKHNVLQINLLNKQRVQKYQMQITKQIISDQNFELKTPKQMFDQIIFILDTESQKDRLSIQDNGTIILKHQKKRIGKPVQVIQRIKTKKFQMNQVQRLQKSIEIMKQQFKSFQKIQDSTKKLIENQKQWIAKQLQIHQQNQQRNIQRQLQSMKIQIVGVDQRQQMSNQQVKLPTNLKQLQTELKAQHEQLNNFINQFTEQIKQINTYLNISSKTKMQNITLPLFFKYVNIISRILQNQKDCQTLFKFFPLKIKYMKILFIASQNNFQISKFHEKCDFTSHTLILIKTEFGKVIGGYTPLQWNQTINAYTNDNSSESFLFSLTNGDKFAHKNIGYSIHNDANSFAFGGGHDICVPDKSNIQSGYANIVIHTQTHQNTLTKLQMHGINLSETAQIVISEHFSTKFIKQYLNDLHIKQFINQLLQAVQNRILFYIFISQDLFTNIRQQQKYSIIFLIDLALMYNQNHKAYHISYILSTQRNSIIGQILLKFRVE